MDCKKKEKHLNTKRNQLAIARQNRKISKLNVAFHNFTGKSLLCMKMSATGCFLENLY